MLTRPNTLGISRRFPLLDASPDKFNLRFALTDAKLLGFSVECSHGPTPLTAAGVFPSLTRLLTNLAFILH